MRNSTVDLIHNTRVNLIFSILYNIVSPKRSNHMIKKIIFSFSCKCPIESMKAGNLIRIFNLTLRTAFGSLNIIWV